MADTFFGFDSTAPVSLKTIKIDRNRKFRRYFHKKSKISSAFYTIPTNAHFSDDALTSSECIPITVFLHFNPMMECFYAFTSGAKPIVIYCMVFVWNFGVVYAL